MPQLTIHPQLVYRTPVFDLNKSLPDVFEDLKEYIGDASPALLQQISKATLPELQEAEDNRWFALWKYFNRAQYRATPFARFAATTSVPLVPGAVGNQQTQLCQELSVHQFCDWDDADAAESMAPAVPQQLIVINATWYSVGHEHRYMALNQHNYRLCCVAGSEIVDFIIQQCLKKITRRSLSELLIEKFGLGKANTKQLIDELILSQLLWTDNMPNITGEDFFARVGAVRRSEKKYIIAERRFLQGGEQANCLSNLPALINFLNTCMPYQPDDYLTNFKSRFLEKFDRQFIPLAIVLDPELGVNVPGFNNGANIKQDEPPVLFSSKNNIDGNSLSRPNTELSAFLLAALVGGNQVIKLEEFNPSANATVPVLPNTSAVVYHMYQQQPVLHALGGCTANALLGRFSLCGGNLSAMARQISAIEQEANPDVLFFDVSFRAEAHVDNINRRQHLYQAELSLSGWSTHSTALQLHDILVGIHGDEVVLYAASLKKKIVPRIASAYNHQRSHLDVYRFMAALQQQSLRANLNFSLHEYFPGLDHYPRVMYHNIIVCPETWVLTATALKQATNAGDDFVIELLSNWLNARGICKHFHVGKADQKLVFNPTLPNDLKLFAAYCKQQGQQPIFLSEALIDPAGEVVTELCEPLFSERILTVYHRQDIYKPFAASWLNEIRQAPLSRKFYPGDDWTYLELYCHAARANSILTCAWAIVVKEQHHLLKKWFFVRYNKGGNHLRLRFQLTDPEQSLSIINLLKAKLADELAAGLISDIRMPTYVREMERYQEGGMDNAESFFYEDSKLVLTILLKHPDTDSLYGYALKTMTVLIGQSFSSDAGRLNFVNIMADRFSNEFELNSADYKSLNKCYKTFRGLQPLTGVKTTAVSKRYIAAFDQYINNCKRQEAVFNFTADAIHMHINRLFSGSQRRHEAILYQYLLNDMKKHRFAPVLQAQC